MTVARTSMVIALAAMLWTAGPIDLTASDELDHAKELYRSASYDEALGVLDGIAIDEGADATEIYEYRVFCLVALDRRDEAQKAIAALVTANPTYVMSEAIASPRVRTMFADVRRSLLPAIIQRAYAEAKASFDRKDPKALGQFERVLTMLKDPDVAGHAGLSDLATVVGGFRDLSKALATPVVTAAPPEIKETPRPVPPTPAPPVFVAPVAVSQPVPVPQIREEREWDGEIEITINDRGRVTAARMTKPIHPVYDQQLVRAALTWTYNPALRDGVPTMFVKQITIHVDTRRACGDRASSSCRPSTVER